MLTTDTTTIADALADIDDRIDDIADTLADLEPGTERYEALASQASTYEYWADGLVWHRDEADWGGDCELTFGAPTAGERALMQREMSDDASDATRRLWWVAVGTEDAPYVPDDETATLHDTFEQVADTLHPAFTAWAEWRIDRVATPGETGNRLQKSLQERQTDATSDETATSSTS